MVNTDKYPILAPESPVYQSLVTRHRQELRDHGVTTLPGLVNTDSISRAVEEVETKVDLSYTMQTHHNIYLTKQDWDQSKEQEHVSNRRLDTKVAALACDVLDESGPLKTLFKSDSFLKFIQQILDVPSLHRNVDPIGAVFVNIYKVSAININYSHSLVNG